MACRPDKYKRARLGTLAMVGMDRKRGTMDGGGDMARSERDRDGTLFHTNLHVLVVSKFTGRTQGLFITLGLRVKGWTFTIGMSKGSYT